MNKINMLLLVLFCFNLAVGQERSESDDFSYALKLYNEKFYNLAAQQFTRFINNYPQSDKLDEAGYYTGLSYFFLKEYKNARVEFQGVAVNYPKSKRAADSWFKIGECYDNLGNKEEAAKAYETVKILYPKHAVAAEAVLRAGKNYQQLGFFEQAEQLFALIQDRYLESSAYIPSLLAQGSLFIQRGQSGKAKEKLQKVIESAGADKEIQAEAYYLLGQLFSSQGYFKDALLNFSRAIDLSPITAIYFKSVLSQSQIYLQTEKYNEAQQIVSRAISAKPNENIKIILLEKLGDSYFLNNQFALALKSYQQTTEHKDDSLFVSRSLKSALCFKNQKLINKAVEELSQIIGEQNFYNYPNYPLAEKKYFEWLDQINNYEQALSVLYKIKSNRVFSISDKSLLIKFLKKSNDWVSILRELEPLVFSEQKFAEKDNFLFDLAEAYEKLENYSESVRLYRKLVREYSASDLAPDALEKLKYFEQHELVDQKIGVSQLALLLGDIINQKDKGNLTFKLGKIYYDHLKDYTSALQQFNNALTFSENENFKSEIFYYIGLSYLRLSEIRGTTEIEKQKNRMLAKENFSKSMENLKTVEKPDLVSWDFVELGIKTDNPPVNKQIGYFETLINKYPQSKYREFWFENLGEIYASSDSTFNKALKCYTELTKNFESSIYFANYLYRLADIKQKLAISAAIDDYKRIAFSYPNSEPAAMALYKIALYYDVNGKYIEANQIYIKLINDFYYTKIAESASQRIGDVYLFSGETKKAIANYYEKIDHLPGDDVVLNREFGFYENASVLFKLAKAYFLSEQWNKSRKYFSLYLAHSDNMHPLRNETHFLMGDLFMQLNDPDGAIESFNKVASTDTTLHKKALLKTGDIYFNQNQYAEASQSYQQLAKIIKSPAEVAAILAKAIISLIRDGKKQAAENLINAYSKRFTKEKNNLAAFQFELGDYYRKAGNYSQAIKYFNNVKNTYRGTDYVDDAEYYLALTYISLNKQNEALNILTKFPSNYPDSDKAGAVLNTLGSIYFRSEKYESAITSFKSALKKSMTPEMKRQVTSNLIKAYTFVNFWDAALALSREYIETYPDAEDCIDKKIVMAQAYVYLNQHDRAVELLKQTRMEADSEKEPEIQFYIGDAFLKAGQYENAIAEFVKIPLLSRKTKLQWEASALYYSGQAYEKMGRIPDAIRMYKEIVDRPGIDVILKKDAQKRINQIKS